VRDQIFANQKRLGVIPQDAKLTPWPDNLLKKWDTLSADEKKMFIRQADVYAAYLMYTDHEIGSVVQAVQDLGKLDITLIIFISGDNGASAEGTVNGTVSENLAVNGVNLTATEQLKYYDVWGTDQTFPLYAVGWAWAFDTPYKWTKQIASYFGGTRNGMAISWPARITDKGGIRTQFHHVIAVHHDRGGNARRLPAANPDKVKEMTDLMFGEFAKYQVLPIERRRYRAGCPRAPR